MCVCKSFLDNCYYLKLKCSNNLLLPSAPPIQSARWSNANICFTAAIASVANYKLLSSSYCVAVASAR